MDTTQYLKEIHPLGGGVFLWESVTVNAVHAEGH